MNYVTLAETHKQGWKHLIVGGTLLFGISELNKTHAAFFYKC